MYSIPARKTIYKNIEMRSRLEADTAKFFDSKKIHWTYEPVRHMDEKNDYLPDFELEISNCKIYVEMKPKIEMFEDAFKKMEFLKNTNIILICGTASWNKYFYDNFYFTSKEVSIQINDILLFLNSKEYNALFLENNTVKTDNVPYLRSPELEQESMNISNVPCRKISLWERIKQLCKYCRQ